MKAIFFEKSGVENLKFGNFEDPKLGEEDVLIKVKIAGTNPIDYNVVTRLPVKPLPHIPGAEVAGTVEKVGNKVKNVKEGDRVVVYNRIFDNTCDLCLRGKEMLLQKWRNHERNN